MRERVFKFLVLHRSLQLQKQGHSNQIFLLKTSSCNCLYVKSLTLATLLLFFRRGSREGEKKLIKNSLKLFVRFYLFSKFFIVAQNFEVNSSLATEKARIEIWRFATSKFRQTTEAKKPQRNPFFADCV